jgi:hypothetical protein
MSTPECYAAQATERFQDDERVFPTDDPGVTSLRIGRACIQFRAALDDHSISSDDEIKGDEDGLVRSILAGLMHWCAANGLDFDTEVEDAQFMFDHDNKAKEPKPC